MEKQIVKNLFMVRFAGDNDFINVVKAFVESIASTIFKDNFKTSKADIARLFNETAYSFYLIHRFDNFPTEEETKKLKSYLQIKEEDVYFDGEISEFTNFNNDGCMAIKICKQVGFTIQYQIV